jgi:protein TonB
MPRPFTLVSVSIHVVVIAGVCVAQMLNVGPLPVLRDALAFSDPTLTPIALVDPPRQRPSAPEPSSSAATVSPSAAPLDAPSAVTPETGRETDASSRLGSPGVGVEQSVDASAPLGVMPGATLPALAPQPQQPIRLHAGIVPPRKIVDVKLVYPALALASRQEGIVILETIIDARGSVETVHVLRGYPLLDQAAVDAVKQWRFTPALLNGEPVPVVMTVTVNFSLKP